MNARQTPTRLVNLFLCTGFSLLAIILLYVFSEHVNHRPNGFIRLFPPHPISARYFKDIGVGSYYIAGITESSIWLCNQTAPAYVYSMDHQLENAHFLKFSVPPKLLFSKGTVILHVDSPGVFLDSYKNSLLLYGSLSSKSLNILDDKMDFLKCVSISESTYIFRVENTNHNQNLIARKNYSFIHKTDTSAVIDPNKTGAFKTDGILFYNKYSGHLFYVYYYQNQFICLDSAMNLLYKEKTLDTISVPHIKISSINNGNNLTLGAPPLRVNMNSCSNGKWLFIQSALVADNEPKGSLDNGSVIDVYQEDNGKYKLSFYVPDDHGSKLRYFSAFKKELVVLFDHTMLVYKLNF